MLSLHGPIRELAAALRTLADALDREQASGAVTYAAAVEADAPSPAPGGMTAALADRFVAQLSPAAVDVLALLCHNAPQLTYEDLQAQAQAQLGIGRAQIGGVLTSLAASRKRLPREVDYPIKRDARHRRYRIEPVAAELLLSAVDRARGTAPPRGWSPGRGGVQSFGLKLTWGRPWGWQSPWQSGGWNRTARNRTGRTGDRTRPAAMRLGITSRTGRVSLLIRKVQVRILPGAPTCRSAP
jgi:hypothetical protein